MHYIHNQTSTLHDAIVVTAADYNGHRGCNHQEKCTAWDGGPFAYPGEKSEFSAFTAPPWLTQAMLKNQLVDHNRGGTDYAQWDVLIDNNYKLARPGDYITFDGYSMHVFTEDEFRTNFRKA